MDSKKLEDYAYSFIDIKSLLALFVILTSFGVFYAPLEWDEGSYLMNAQYFSGEEANPEHSRPAALSALVSLLWLVTGESTVTARMLVAVFGASTVYIFYRLADREFHNALPATSVFAFTPLLIYWSSHVYTDVPALLFVLGGLYAYKIRRYLVSGIMLSVAATFRYVFIVFAVGLGIAYLIENYQEIPYYSAGGLIGALPFFSYSYIGYGAPWRKIVMYTTRVSEWSNSGLFAATLTNAGNAVYMLSTLIPAAYNGWRETPVAEKGMLLAYTGFILFISGNSFQRYWLPAMPFLLLIAYRGLGKRLFTAIAVSMLLISAHGVGNNYLDQQECMAPLEDSLDYVSQFEGLVISDQWTLAGYIMDNPVQSTWTDLDSLRNGEGAEYAVMSSEHPYQVMESFSSNCTTYYVYNLREPV